MSKNNSSKRNKLNSRQVFIISMVVFLGVGIVLSTVVYSTFRNWGMQETNPGVIGTPVFDEEGNLVLPDSSGNQFSDTGNRPFISDKPPAWDGTKRVTMLVMGIDYRDWAAGYEYSRTDTMILLTIDPVAKTAGALSIPRDLWAAIPGFNPAKINTAHYFGDLYNYPGGGPALAVKTVENVIGVPIDYYARLDFSAFVEFIDMIDGVTVDVTEPIELEVIGQAYDVKLEPGRVTLPGKLALAYARNRHNEGGDFDRSRRQQQVILGIYDRLRTPAVWAKLISNAPELYDKFSKKITTNLPFEDALKLAFLAVKIKQEDIQMAVIGLNEVQFGKSPDDLSILSPLPDKIRELRDRIFATGGSFSPAMEGDPLTLMQIEEARISIYDGTNDGVTAQRTADYLRNLGANVVSVQGAGQGYTNTSLIDHTGSPYTLAYLSDLMGVGTYRIFHRLAIDSDTDVEIWLGTDWQYNNPMP
ncbi:MAG: LCP family protein [Anaerolineales bacterium]